MLAFSSVYNPIFIVRSTDSEEIEDFRAERCEVVCEAQTARKSEIFERSAAGRVVYENNLL